MGKWSRLRVARAKISLSWLGSRPFFPMTYLLLEITPEVS
jgi:hypothetical protein